MHNAVLGIKPRKWKRCKDCKQLFEGHSTRCPDCWEHRRQAAHDKPIVHKPRVRH